MLPKRRMLALMTVAVCCGIVFPAAAAEPTSVALTMTKAAGDAKDLELAESLLSLVELAVQVDKSLTVVERRAIDLAIQELILDAARPGDSQLRLGKLVTADFLAMLELLPPDNDLDSKKPWVRLRLVDPKSGVIRGVTVASLDEATLEETVDQFSQYVSAVARAPEKPTVTVAVLPFESKGRFDRLRPLELGIRDLITARLVELSGAASVNPATPKEEAPEQSPRFQVVQRATMAELLRELDLIQSGFSDKSRLTEPAPSRGAAYLVRGEIDEHQDGDSYAVVVRGEMIDARSNDVAETFKLECPPKELDATLAGQVDRIAVQLSKDLVVPHPSQASGNVEVQSLRKQTFTDLRRFQRADPSTGEQPYFSLPGQQPFSGVFHGVKVRTPLGQHLLRKSIDRLESILFITPDDAEAAFALGYCYSMTEEGFYQPKRADELFRKVVALARDTQLEALALNNLRQIDFDDQSHELLPGHQSDAVDRIWYVFVNMPPKYDFRRWLLLRDLGRFYRQPNQIQQLADLLAKATPFAENSPPERRKMMAMAVQELALQLINQAQAQAELKAKGLALLNRWAEGDDKELAYWGRKGLATLKRGSNDLVGAAAANEASAALLTNLDSPEERDRRDALLIEAARLYREGGEPQRALTLLESFAVRFPQGEMCPGDLPGKHEYEIGCCLELLGQADRALPFFLRATQINPTVAVSTDIVKHIEALGGVPLDPHRDVEVKYYDYYQGASAPVHAAKNRLATDGRKIYYSDPRGVHAFNLESKSWEPMGFPLPAATVPPQTATPSQQAETLRFDTVIVSPQPGTAPPPATDRRQTAPGRPRAAIGPAQPGTTPAPRATVPPQTVTALQCGAGSLFVGTEADGVWQCDLSSGRFQGACPLDRLPDPHVEALALDGGDLYIGVGTKASGGLLKLESSGDLHVFNEPGAPSVAPTHIVVAKHRIWARTPEAVFQWSETLAAWTSESPKGWGYGTPTLFAGSKAIWASGRRHELGEWGASEEENQQFKKAWYLPENNVGQVISYGKGGLHVQFVTQHGDDVWFGGETWAPFVSTGLYRFRLKTGEFHKFSPADGFRMSRGRRLQEAIGDGLWVGDQLWLSTADGLCVVTPKE